MNKGLFIIYTGNGKGKTTAALGLGLRAMGHGLRVCMIQFIKSGKNYGEHKIKDYLGSLYTWHVMGKGFIFSDFADLRDLSKDDLDKNRKAASDAWELTKKVVHSQEYRLIILDELTYLFSFNLLDQKEVLDFLINRPEGIHIIITGRNAPLAFINKADIVTEMKEIKHAFKEGIKAQKGIEW